MNLEQIAIKVKEISEKSCEGQIKLGGLLIDAKSKVKHGQWKKWLDTNTNFSQSKANKLMKAYRMVEVSKSYTYTNLDIHKVLALTTLKEEIDVEIFMQNFDLENMSVREIEKEVRRYNKELKKDEMEQKKSNEVAEEHYTEDKIYTKIETEIKVDDVAYYPIDEVRCVMGYKTLKDFYEKYSNLIVTIKGSECIRVSDFLRISAEENSEYDNLDFDNSLVDVEVFNTEIADMVGTHISYKIKKRKGHNSELIQLRSSKIATSCKVDSNKVREIVIEQLANMKIYDKNTINCTTSFILEHLESIKELLIKGQQQYEQWRNAWDNAFGINESQEVATTLNKSEYRALCKVCHPDNGGSNELMNIISRLYSK